MGVRRDVRRRDRKQKKSKKLKFQTVSKCEILKKNIKNCGKIAKIFNFSYSE
jgi:hypothetical protein